VKRRALKHGPGLFFRATVYVAVKWAASAPMRAAKLGRASGLIRLFLASAFLTCFAGCATNREPILADGHLISLEKSIKPFIDCFNAAADQRRVLAVVSPTCGACVAGAVAVKRGVVQEFSDRDVLTVIVWIDMLPSDNQKTAEAASVIFDKGHVVQFHDPNQRVGKALARGIVSNGPAWDTYLTYSPGSRWEDRPPEPFDWSHQLGGQGADTRRYRAREHLAAAMREALIHLGATPLTANPPGAPEFNEALGTAIAKIRGQSQQAGAEDELCPQCARQFKDMACPLPQGTGLSITRPGLTPNLKAKPIRLRVEGLVCRSCPLRLATGLALVPKAARIDVDAVNSIATIWPPLGSELDPTVLIGAAKAAGFDAVLARESEQPASEKKE